jgi:hypothetical protein
MLINGVYIQNNLKLGGAPTLWPIQSSRLACDTPVWEFSNISPQNKPRGIDAFRGYYVNIEFRYTDAHYSHEILISPSPVSLWSPLPIHGLGPKPWRFSAPPLIWIISINSDSYPLYNTGDEWLTSLKNSWCNGKTSSYNTTELLTIN